MRRVVSVSKRTDIPCWHSEWFMNRMRQGTVSYPNPMTGQEVKLSLKKADVQALVFWTKNFHPMLKHMDEFESFGIPYYTHFTINDYPKEYEAHVGSLAVRVEAFKKLAARGSDVLWRYDPIILSHDTERDFHLEAFSRIAGMLKGHTKSCTISFLDMYAKTCKNMSKLPSGLRVASPGKEEMNLLASKMQLIAQANGMTLSTCAEVSVVSCKSGSCIDAERIGKMTNEVVLRKAGNRSGCLCADHRDIGAYDTCPSGCIYCYAVGDVKEGVSFMKEQYDPKEVSLVKIHKGVRDVCGSC